jgi:hypothetical protein
VDRRDDSEAKWWRELELTGVVVRSFWCKRAKLGSLGSTSGLLWCCWSTRSGLGGSNDGCRRRAVVAVEVRRGVVLGRGNGSGNADA